MFWRVNYIVDDGYTWNHRVCIINTDNKEKALEILHTEIGSKLKGESFILDEYTEVMECEKNVILYDGWK